MKIPSDYVPTAIVYKKSRNAKADKEFIERQLKVSGYRLEEVSAFYYLTNDPRAKWI